MNKKKLASLVVGLVMAVGAAPAFAVPIIGGISFSDGFQTTGTTTSVVSGLNTFDVINGPGIAQVNGCTGSFGACTPPPVVFGAANDFTHGVPSLAYTYAGFTFTINTYAPKVPTALSCNAQGICTDALQFVGQGVVDDGPGGLDASQFQIVWTANGSCLGNLPAGCTGNVTASWSSSITATGQPVTTPEPSALLLVGAGLIGSVLFRRNRKLRD